MPSMELPNMGGRSVLGKMRKMAKGKVHVPVDKRKEAEETMCRKKWDRGEECNIDWSKHQDPNALKEAEEEYERQQDMAEL